ncbi:hypothetical protein AwErysi_02020 [Erysipelotrichaceae bacterium]|nr:hypothetical protein AwErysi_02020 [Erysipelotrichaceae bacterium]
MINRHAIKHQAISSDAYAFSKTTVHLRLRAAKGDLSAVYCLSDAPKIEAAKQTGQWHWIKKQSALVKEHSTALFDYWFLSIEPEDYKMRYGFKLIGANETLMYIERGFFPEDDPTIADDINSYFAFPYIHPCDIVKVPEFVKTTNWYQIFPDRFYNGNRENDPINTVAWNFTPPTNEHPYGGDLAGITAKLDYLVELGINGIYLTPIFKAPSIHKYDTISYYEIDPSFGSKAELKTLIEQAHSRGIKIMLDAVFNHIGSDAKEFLDVVENGENSKYYDWFHINKLPLTTSDGDLIPENYRNFCKTMPKLNTANPEVVAYLLAIAVYWVKTFDIDAWRLDVANEVDHVFWRKFRIAVREVKPDIYILGETWHQSNAWLQGDQFDGTMNYPLTKPILEWIALGNINGITFQQSFVEAILCYSENINMGMFNLLDSHDTPRLLTLTKGNLEKTKLCYTVLYALKGSTCIFYGSELALSGGADPLCRGAMPWERLNKPKPLFDHLQKLLQLRKAYPMIASEGGYHFEVVQEDLVIFTRYHESMGVYYLLYTGKEEQEISLPTSLAGKDVLDIYYNSQQKLKQTLVIKPYGIYMFLGSFQIK